MTNAQPTQREKQKSKSEDFSIVFETFRRLGSFEIGRLTENQPSCFNGNVAIRKYRVTIEEIEEPKEALQGRLLKLWHECDNHHHWQPLKCAAGELGIELNTNEAGKDRKKRP